jgi:sodium transport system permease protein
MAVAIRCRSVKEAQASAGLVVLACSLLPLAGLFNLGEETPWHLWVPALAQNTLMTRVLRADAFGAEQWLIPPAVCTVLTIAALAFVARRLRHAAVR